MPEDIFVNNVIKVLPSESLYSSQLKQVSKHRNTDSLVVGASK